VIEVVSIRGEALAGNALGDPIERRVPVVTPPGYDPDGSRSYPTVYFLAGFSGGGVYTLGESIWSENVPQRVERLMAAGEIAPMIFVIPDCVTRLGGSQYINSAATGRYEDHLIDDVVPFIDRSYRTRADREYRAVMGKSSGGYGATVLAMRRPDVFAHAADHSGDKYFDFCYRADIPHVVAALGNYGNSPAAFLRDFPHPPESRGRGWFTIVNMLAMASCYAPNPASEIGFDLPFTLDTGETIDAVWKRWLEHDPVTLADRHAAALASLRTYWIDCGRWDEHHLQLGARIYCRKLRELGIAHTYEEFEGGHRNTAHRYDSSLRAFSAAWA
jgi:enterochelin esterase family protein